VVVDTAAWKVDEAATRKLRAELRARRGSGALPVIARAGRPPKAA
jgi:hypothetical protein